MSVVPFIIIFALVGIDQLTKWIMTIWLKPIDTYELIPGFIRFRYVLNDGAAFSMLRNGRWLFVFVTVVLVALCFAALISRRMRYQFPALKRPIVKAALIMVSAGGIGNLIDRLVRGLVIDFIEPTFVNFAVFNFADILVTCAAAIFIIYLVYDIVTEYKDKRDYKRK